MRPQLSVVLTAIGRQPALTRCLLSVLGEDLAVEVVLVSTKDNHSEARAWADHDSRIRVVPIPHGCTVERGRELGLARAVGQYVTFLDSRSIVVAGAYKIMLALLAERQPDLANSAVTTDTKVSLSPPDSTIEIGPAQACAAISAPDGSALVAGGPLVGNFFRRDYLVEPQVRRDWLIDEVGPTAASLAATHVAATQITTTIVEADGRASDTLPGWLTRLSTATSLVAEHPSAPVRASFAVRILEHELMPALGKIQTAPATVVDSAATLLATLIGWIPRPLGSYPPQSRWRVALTILRQPTLLSTDLRHTERTGDPAALGPDADSLVPESLKAMLGLGSNSIEEAFRARFVHATNHLNDEVGSAGDGVEVSVIVPTHNVEPWIDECIRSIRGASGVRLEIIIVDDHSSDGTWETIQRHAAEDARVRAVQSSGTGGGQARNIGVELARGEFLAFADGDDLIPPNAYRAMLAAARRTGVDLVTGSYLKFFPNKIWDPGRTYQYGLEMAAVSLPEQPAVISHRACWNRLIRRQFWLEHALPFPGVPRSNDIVPMVSALTSVSKLTVLPEITYLYRARPGSGSMTSGLGSVLPTVSYLGQELICAQMVSEVGDPGVSAAFWDAVLNRDGWQNFQLLLRSPRTDPNDLSMVAEALETLHSKAPASSLRAMSAIQQGIYALARKNLFSQARDLLRAVDDPVTTEDACGLLEEIAKTGLVAGPALGALIEYLLLTPLAADERCDAGLLTRAAHIVVRLVENCGAEVTLVPGTEEHQILMNMLRWSATESGSILPLSVGLTARVVSRTPHRLVVGGPAPRGAAVPSSLWATRVVDGVQVSIPVAKVSAESHGERWRADFDVVQKLRPGPWRLHALVENALHPTSTVEVTGLQSSAGLFRRYSATGVVQGSTRIVVRATLFGRTWQRVAAAATSIARGLVRALLGTGSLGHAVQPEDDRSGTGRRSGRAVDTH